MNDSFVKRFLLTCNPWFLASTVVLLVGIYLIYVDPKLVGKETLQINMSFYSLQAYELLCLGTVFLFMRIKLFYDSIFLVVILSMLLFVPFITFNHVLQYDGLELLGYIALVLAAVKLVSLKLFFKDLNLPWMILAAGFLMLVMNFSIPFAMLGLNLEEDLAGKEFIHQVFSIAIPLIGLIGYIAMYQIKSGKRIFQSKWVPITLFECFFTVTLVNLMSVMFVYDIEYNSLFFSSTFLVSCFLSMHPIIGLNKISKQIILSIALLTSIIVLGPEFKIHFTIALGLCLLFAIGLGEKWLGFTAFSFLILLGLSQLPLLTMKYSQLCITSALLVSLAYSRQKQDWQSLLLPGLLLELLLVTYSVKSASALVLAPMSLCLFLAMLWDKEPFQKAKGMLISLAILWAGSGAFAHFINGWQLSFNLGILILSVQLFRKFVAKEELPNIFLYISGGMVFLWPIEKLINILKMQSYSIIVIAVSFIIFIAGTCVTYSKRIKPT